MAIEHEPWIGKDYKRGIESQRIAIVGHSHHRNEDYPDRVKFTKEVIDDVISGRESYLFFTAIRNYFGYGDHSEFWNRVIFFNYLPDCVGVDDERFKCGSSQQIDGAKSRFLKILQNTNPHIQKVFVFSNSVGKGWPTLPETEEESQAGRANQLPGLPDFGWGTYRFPGHAVQAVGLRHPQGAPKELMTKAVRQMMSLMADGSLKEDEGR